MKKNVGLAILLATLCISSAYGFDRLITDAGISLNNQQQIRQKYLMCRPADLSAVWDSNGRPKTFIEALCGTREERDLEGDSALDTPAKISDRQMLMDEEPNFIYIDSDITSNQIWTADNIYWVSNSINVQALLVIEPGTEIRLDAYCGIYVNNGGCLISCGTPDNLIHYRSIYVDPSHWYFYQCAIYVDETASPATKIQYNFVQYASVGIVADNIQLDTPISNNYLFFNVFGIGEKGTHFTDIINNLAVANMGSGIDIIMENWDGVADGNSYILIKNNTSDAYYWDNGISVHGTEDPNNAGFIELINNIVSGAYFCGFNLCPLEDGETYMLGFVSNTGYCGNYMNKNWDFPEENPVVDNNDIYIEGVDFVDWCYLDQSCGFIDAGLGYIEETPMIGMTTDIEGTPDSNIIDIGFHHPNWRYSNAGATTLQADFNNDLAVDFNDLYIFVEYWLFDYNDSYQAWMRDIDDSGKVDFGDLMIITEYWLEPYDFGAFAWFAEQWQREVDERFFNWRPDIVPDNRVDFRDFAVLANEWGKTGDAVPNIQIDIYGDGSNGYVEVGISNYTQDTSRAFLLVDGQYIDNLDGFEDDQHALVNVAALGMGPHQFKVISMDNSSRIICSHIKEAEFNSPLNYCLCNNAYEVNKPLYFCAYVPELEDVTVKAIDDENNVLWMQTYPDGNVNDYVPAGITGTYMIDQIVLEKNPAGGMQLMSARGCLTADGGSSSGLIALEVTPKLEPKNIKLNVRALIVSPDERISQRNEHIRVIVRNTFKAHNVQYYELENSQATASNLAWFAQNRNIQYLYFNGHGDYRDEGRTFRTNIILYDGYRCFSFKQSDFPPDSIPPWCEQLSGHAEFFGRSIKGIGFHTLKFAQFDSCYSGCLKFSGDRLIKGLKNTTGLNLNAPNDMTQALGIGLTGDSESFYQGWFDCYTSDPFSTFSKFTKDEWGKLREGYKFYYSINYAWSEALWDPIIDGYPKKELRLFGQHLYFHRIYGIE